MQPRHMPSWLGLDNVLHFHRIDAASQCSATHSPLCATWMRVNLYFKTTLTSPPTPSREQTVQEIHVQSLVCRAMFNVHYTICYNVFEATLQFEQRITVFVTQLSHFIIFLCITMK